MAIFSDGRQFYWGLYGEIYKERSRVSLKKHGKTMNVTFHMKKKEPGNWEKLEVYFKVIN